MGTLRKVNRGLVGEMESGGYTPGLRFKPEMNRLEFSPTALKQLHDITWNNTVMNPGDMWFSTSPTTTGQVSYFIGSDDPGPLYKKDHSEYTKAKTELDSIIAHYYGRSLLI